MIILYTNNAIHLSSFSLQVGDRVVALPEFRAWSELVAVPTKYVYHIPDEMTFQDAAAIVMNYLVAYILIFDLISLREGKSILLHSVGGGVVSAGTMGVGGNGYYFG